METAVRAVAISRHRDDGVRSACALHQQGCVWSSADRKVDHRPAQSKRRVLLHTGGLFSVFVVLCVVFDKA